MVFVSQLGYITPAYKVYRLCHGEDVRGFTSEKRENVLKGRKIYDTGRKTHVIATTKWKR